MASWPGGQGALHCTALCCACWLRWPGLGCAPSFLHARAVVCCAMLGVQVDDVAAMTEAAHLAAYVDALAQVGGAGGQAIVDGWPGAQAGKGGGVGRRPPPLSEPVALCPNASGSCRRLIL